MHRTYVPEDVLRHRHHHQLQWTIGWEDQRQTCVIQHVDKSRIDESTLASILRQLSHDEELQPLWEYTHGPPIMIQSPQSFDPINSQLITYVPPHASHFFALQQPFDGADQLSSTVTPLGLTLHRINASRTINEIIQHYVNKHSNSEELDSNFDLFRHRPNILQRLVHLIFRPVDAFITLIFAILSLILYFPSFSLTHAFGSFFTPTLTRSVIWLKQPLWKSSEMLTVIEEKARGWRRIKELREQRRIDEKHLFNVTTSARLRSREEYYSLLCNHLLDLSLGFIVGLILLQSLAVIDRPFIERLSQRLVQLWPSELVKQLIGIIQWLLSSSAPAGLKLNPRLHFMFGSLVQQIAREEIIIIHSLYKFAHPLASQLLRTASIAFACTVMMFGVRLFLGFILDCLWWISLPLTLTAHALRRIFAFTIGIFYSLLLLFRGKKRNILRRQRIDSFPSSFEHVILGTLCLVTITFLFPTVAVWYGIGVATVGVVYDGPKFMIKLIMSVIQYSPIVGCIMRWMDHIAADSVRNGHRIPAGVSFQLRTIADQSHPLHYLQLHSTPAPFLILFFRYRAYLRTVLERHPPKRILMGLLTGS